MVGRGGIYGDMHGDGQPGIADEILMHNEWSDGWPHTKEQYARSIIWAACIGAAIGSVVGPLVVYFVLKQFG